MYGTRSCSPMTSNASTACSGRLIGELMEDVGDASGTGQIPVILSNLDSTDAPPPPSRLGFAISSGATLSGPNRHRRDVYTRPRTSRRPHTGTLGCLRFVTIERERGVNLRQAQVLEAPSTMNPASWCSPYGSARSTSFRSIWVLHAHGTERPHHQLHTAVDQSRSVSGSHEGHMWWISGCFIKNRCVTL